MSDRDSATNIIMTGGTGGLGTATVTEVCRNDDWHIVLACRSQDKAIAVRENVLGSDERGERTEISIATGFDMNAPDQIKEAVADLKGERPFDVVFLGSGGVVFGQDFQTIEYNGHEIERTIFQNVVGGHIVLGELKRNKLLQPGARVVVAGGEGARGIDGFIAKPTISSPDELRRYVLAQDFGGSYRSMDAIGVSKLMSALWVRKLARLEGNNMSVVWFTPGLTYGTGGLDGLPPVKRWIMRRMLSLFGLLGRAGSPGSGGRRFADCLERKIGRSGDLIGTPEGKAAGALVSQEPMHPAFTDESLQDEFWNILEDVCGPFPGNEQI